MRQLIIGADVAGPFTSAAEGSVSLQYIQASGVPALVNAAQAAKILTGDMQFRFVRRGASDAEAEVASPWLKPSDVISWTAKTYDAGQKQILKNDCDVAGTAGAEYIYKVILTTSGYEPFKRYSFHAKCGADVSASAVALELVIQAAIDAGTHPELHDVSVTAGNKINLTLADGERGVVVVDPLDSGCAWSREPEQAFIFPVGTYTKLLAEEVEQQGREWSNYDRYTALPDENKTYAVSGETYNEYSVRFKNSAEGQIRGVDNIREIKLAIPNAAGTYLDGGSNADSGETFEHIVAAALGLDRLEANGD